MNVAAADSGLWVWLMPVLIFLAGLTYLTLSSVRTIFLSRGLKGWAAVLGFAETVIFLLAISQILANVANVANVIAYAAGYGLGNLAGIIVEEKLALGTVLVRLITRKDASELIRDMESRQFGVTSVGARGVSGKVRIVFTVVRRRDLKSLLRMIESFHPRAFVSIEDVRSVSAGVLPGTPGARFGARSFFWNR